MIFRSFCLPTWILSVVVSVVLVGCAGSPSKLESDNTRSMLSLKPDMTIDQVTKNMGVPQKTEMYRGKNNEIVLTYLYLTNGLGYVTNPENETNYTPLIFIDNKLNGWGWNQLDSAAKRYEFIVKKR